MSSVVMVLTRVFWRTYYARYFMDTSNTKQWTLACMFFDNVPKLKQTIAIIISMLGLDQYTTIALEFALGGCTFVTSWN